ncbi:MULTISPECIES: SRPBCC family protein [unclassified Picosynechococcus]|uniref:SRPBCC family protein n=1 Tax=unclassified Picosynechococcus TaxID=3079910 RepID=UPI0004AA7AC8|nr:MULTISPECIES: SRPBCC family protein [unclassified Picosynechococcus]AMA07995.1 polyketide cyclase [Picosynechococcus sp. PCC 73109]ANV86133.1 polyketide cyclase [Picosynechococcus sp. PCC 7117]ANV89310.1 polyketide cyclase [Picosynechococcus sp. PCC 8807]QCS48808.1 SRPBCC family protein [Picosynechococcus sp. PCC 11901]
MEIFEQSIQVRASATCVEQCFTDLETMHRWLNPLLRCEPLGDRWSTALESQSRFWLKIPLVNLVLNNRVVEREPGLIVWQFTGFFRGRDRWECIPNATGTQLVNRFQFEIPNPLVRWGFKTFAARWTKKDMQAQLRRIKAIAEATQP